MTTKAHFADIHKIESKEVMRSQSAGKHTVHYKIMASLRNGKKMLLAKQVEGERAAHLIVEYYYEVTGLKDSLNLEPSLVINIMLLLFTLYIRLLY